MTNHFALRTEELATKVLNEWAITTHRHGTYWLNGTEWDTFTSKEPMLKSRLIEHFSGETFADHSFKLRECKRVGMLYQAKIGDQWLSKGWCNETDNHNEVTTEENTQEALNVAIAIGKDIIATYGVLPLLEHNGGKGGCHCMVFFKNPIRMVHARQLGKRISDKINPKIEVFPKQDTDPKDPDAVGNWVKLPGAHHKRDEISSFYDFTTNQWITGENAVQFMLNYPLQDETLLPPYEPPPEPLPNIKFDDSGEYKNDWQEGSYLEHFINKHNIKITDKGNAIFGGRNYRRYWVTCPFTHTSGVNHHNDSYILVRDDGQIGYHCSHTSCNNRHWKDFKQHYDPTVKNQNIDTKHLKEPFNLIPIFEKTPQQIQKLTRLIFTICPKLPTIAAFWMAWAVASASMGKYIIGKNGANVLYLNLWICCLVASGKGKSEINAIRKLVQKAVRESPERSFTFLQNSFTFAYLFNDMGGGQITSKELKKMDDLEKFTAQEQADEKSRRKMARFSCSEELTFTFEKIIQSGTITGEFGKALLLADGGADIDGSTNTDGYRKIVDACVSLFGVTQIQNWHKHFCSGTFIEQGLPQRFITVNPHHYTFPLEPFDLSPEAVEIEIVQIVKDFIIRATYYKNTYCTIWDRRNPTDYVRDGWDKLSQLPMVKPFMDYGMVALDDVDGKLIVQSLKMMGIHWILEHIEPLAYDGTSSLEPKPQKIDFNNPEIYQMYLEMLMVNYCKHATTDVIDPETAKLYRRIITHLAKAKNHTLLLRELFLKMKGSEIRFTKDLEPFVSVLEELGFLTIEKEKYIHWTGKTQKIGVEKP